MNRQQWKDLAEVIGFVSIVASLVFVGIETRNSTKQSMLNTQALEIAAYQSLMSNIDEINALSLGNTEAAGTLMKIWDEDSKNMWGDEAKDIERFKQDRALFILFRHGDLAYFMYERGAIDESRLRSALAPVPIGSEVGREFWQRTKVYFTDGYREYIDRRIAELETAGAGQ